MIGMMMARLKTWVLTFDFCHGEGQDLLDPTLQNKLLQLIQTGAFRLVLFGVLVQRPSVQVSLERSTRLFAADLSLLDWTTSARR